MVTAGIHEGKNEICARVGYFKLGIDLKTETPSAQQVRNAVFRIESDDIYKKAVEKLRDEFNEYQPLELVSQYAEEAIKSVKRKTPREYGLFELEAA
jgi:UDP:flavonoid glycosyltransferase YjiC (YdhE family)